jgi:transposase-like protein
MNEQTIVKKKRNSPPRGAGGAKKVRRFTADEKLKAVRLRLEEGFSLADVCAEIGEDESRLGIITAPVEGRIDGLAMNCNGEQVHQRQPFANIFSRTLLDAADEYKRAFKTGGMDCRRAF